ncbi:hypothetical protein VVS316_00491 [Vibrio vulnificus]|nr:hypothetical protein VVS316_00491 [Vibrio vulnificus]
MVVVHFSFLLKIENIILNFNILSISLMLMYLASFMAISLITYQLALLSRQTKWVTNNDLLKEL